MTKTKLIREMKRNGFSFTTKLLPDDTEATKVTRFPYQGQKYTVKEVLAYERIPCNSYGRSPGKVGVYHASDDSGSELYVAITNGRNSRDPNFMIIETSKTLPELCVKLLGGDTPESLTAISALGEFLKNPEVKEGIFSRIDLVNKKR